MWIMGYNYHFPSNWLYLVMMFENNTIKICIFIDSKFPNINVLQHHIKTKQQESIIILYII